MATMQGTPADSFQQRILPGRRAPGCGTGRKGGDGTEVKLDAPPSSPTRHIRNHTPTQKDEQKTIPNSLDLQLAPCVHLLGDDRQELHAAAQRSRAVRSVRTAPPNQRSWQGSRVPSRPATGGGGARHGGARRGAGWECAPHGTGVRAREGGGLAQAPGSPTWKPPCAAALTRVQRNRIKSACGGWRLRLLGTPSQRWGATPSYGGLPPSHLARYSSSTAVRMCCVISWICATGAARTAWAQRAAGPSWLAQQRIPRGWRGLGE